MLRCQKIGQWSQNPKVRALDGRSIYPLGFPASLFYDLSTQMGLKTYGQFVSTQAYGIDASAFAYTSSILGPGMTLTSSKNIILPISGNYLFTTTIDWQHTGGGVAHTGRQWLQKGSTPIADSAFELTINGGGTNELPITSQFVISAIAGDSITVWYAVDNISLNPTPQAATIAPVPFSVDTPAVPSAVVSVLYLD